ncbi:phenolic glucoside malonyltransferase [Trifolium repens]|nr:phenolic glucoside malonyltransferase [Trifolium repens]
MKSKVQTCESPKIPLFGFPFTDLAVVSGYSYDYDYLIDVIGLISGISNEREYVRDGKITKMLVLELTDKRNHLDQQIPATYFGNCIGGRIAIVETCKLLGEDGLIVAVEVMSEALETLKVGVLNGAEDWCSGLVEGVATADVKTVGAAGSPKFEVYSTDFGCGKPKKVEMASIDRTGAFCISDCRNGDGVEMVLCLRKEQWRHLLLSLQMSLHLKAFIWCRHFRLKTSLLPDTCQC